MYFATGCRRNIIAANGEKLPVNTVVTPTGRWKTLYALVVCWRTARGPPEDLQNTGHFWFDATQMQG